MSRLSKSIPPPYHLRPNKAIDRFLFLEIIEALNCRCDFGKYTYVGLAGPFLEDFRLISNRFPKMELHSVEADGEIFKRQKFHKCSSKLKLYHCGFREYLEQMFPENPTIAWIDYTDFSRECLSEISHLAKICTINSLLRVTVKAETDIYRSLKIHRSEKECPPKKKKSWNEYKIAFEKEISFEGVSYDNSLFVFDNFLEEKYPMLLKEILFTVIETSCTHPKTFLPLHAVKYSDGTIMLSVTGLLCDQKDRNMFVDHFKKCEIVGNRECMDVEVIDVPTLTIKERLKLDAALPRDVRNNLSCLKRLGYLIEGEGSDSRSEKKIKEYEKYYRFYPYFGKVLP